MSMNFGSGGTSPNAKCEICEAEVKPSEKLVVEKHTMHSKCFKCAFCDVKLSVGACAMEPSRTINPAVEKRRSLSELVADAQSWIQHCG
uniref:LIM zinc-binding domain-containing protein n=1 Tax=Globodera pallida TaxID=36090 RepID=A0A183BQZ8_GLOPA